MEEDARPRKIIKVIYLCSASRVLGGSKIPSGERAEKTIEIAKKFEKYIGEDDLTALDDDEKQ